MNRIEDTVRTADAANIFKEEVLELSPGIQKEVLCDMVDDYIYYQKTDVTREEAKRVIEETCLIK